MMQTIYVDVLIVLNIYVNYFLLRTTAKLTRVSLGFGRCAGAAMYGSLFSLIILLPDINTLVNWCIRLAAAASIVAAAFGIQCISRFLLNTVVFFAVNFIFGGAVYCVCSWLEPDFVHFNNSYIYIDFSLVILVITTALLYLGVCILRYFYDKMPKDSGCYRVTIRSGDKIVAMSGLADTGNLLVDFFSGKPVIVCSKEIISALSSLDTDFSGEGKLPKGFRLIPCSTVSENGLMPVFSPDEIVISDIRNKMSKSVEAIIGIGSADDAVFNPKLLRL